MPSLCEIRQVGRRLAFKSGIALSAANAYRQRTTPRANLGSGDVLRDQIHRECVNRPFQLLIVEVAVACLTLLALAINRLAGLDYPLWAPTAQRPSSPQRQQG